MERGERSDFKFRPQTTLKRDHLALRTSVGDLRREIDHCLRDAGSALASRIQLWKAAGESAAQATERECRVKEAAWAAAHSESAQRLDAAQKEAASQAAALAAAASRYSALEAATGRTMAEAEQAVTQLAATHDSETKRLRAEVSYHAP